MKSYIVYHQKSPGVDCADGIISAAIANLYLRRNNRKKEDIYVIGDSYLHKNDYSATPNFFKFPFRQDDEVIIVDFSYPDTYLNYWQDAGVKLTIIDHHEDKFPMLQNFSGAILDANHCGATLTWKHFFPSHTKDIPHILEHVWNRDTGANGYYEDKCLNSVAINAALDAFRKGYKSHNKIELLEHLASIIWASSESYLGGEATLLTLFGIGKGLLDAKDKAVKSICSRAKLAVLQTEQEYTVPYILLTVEESEYYSDIGTALAKEYFECPFSWVEIMHTDGNTSHSLRSTGFDTRSIAKYFGGGGHIRASGFSSLTKAI